MSWRHLLTTQFPVVHEIPEDCTSTSSYVEEFERLNHLVPTRARFDVRALLADIVRRAPRAKGDGVSPESINTGDLVAVVRGHACVLQEIGGIPFRVYQMRHNEGGQYKCNICHAWETHTETCVGMGPNLIPVSFLKKFPPLADPEAELRDMRAPEEIAA